MHASISLEPFIYYEILCHTQFKLLFFLMLLNIMWRRQSKTRKSGSGGASSHPPSPLKLIIQMAQRKRCEKKKSRRKLVQATLRTMISCRPLTWTRKLENPCNIWPTLRTNCLELIESESLATNAHTETGQTISICNSWKLRMEAVESMAYIMLD